MTTHHTARTRTWAVPATAALVLAAVAGGLAAGPVFAATDDPTEGGLWYYTVPGLPEIHATGVTGEGITVAVIDGPIYPDSPDLAGTNLILPDASFCDDDRDGVAEPATSTTFNAEHATTLTALIIGTGAGINGEPGVQGVAPDATVYVYPYSTTVAACELNGRDGATVEFEQAIADGADVINMSISGWGNKPEGLAALARAQRSGVIVVAAANDMDVSGMGFPAAANGVVAVEAADVDRSLRRDAVAHPLLTVVAPGVDIRGLAQRADWQAYGLGTGSSQATAWVSGVLALAWSQYPDATANQMIQALLRTTSQSDGGLTRVDDHWGYGMVNARNLVGIDPTTLPDVNPLLRDDPDAQPTIDQIMGTQPDPGAEPTEPVTDPDPEPTQAAPAPTDPDATGPPPALIITLVAALALAGAITTVIQLRRRTTPVTGPPAPPGPSTPPTPGD